MNTPTDFPKQRNVYLSKALKQSGDTKKRPIVIVSIDIRNQYSSTVLVVPFSSDLSQSANPCRILIERGDGGLKADSVAMCDVITCIKKQYLEPQPYGKISQKCFEQILQAIQITIGIY